MFCVLLQHINVIHNCDFKTISHFYHEYGKNISNIQQFFYYTVKKVYFWNDEKLIFLLVNLFLTIE